MNDRGRERDLVLAPNEFAFILDETKGNINVYVGPHKTSLANTDAPVVFDAGSKRFERRQLDGAIQALSIAPEGWYLVLKNPATDKSHPRTGALNNLPSLDTGRKVNIPGPASFALWPGQMVRVIQGHHLRSNQYLLVRVYDEEGAKANWKNAVLRMRPEAAADEGEAVHVQRPPDLTMGTLLIIRGTEVAFYIPPTGVEVVPDVEGNYVREAITLERLEYCILLDENGNKRYIQGPAVVFPQPTETFVAMRGARKFRAIELNENTGLYIKVIAPYEENGVRYKVGDELFITGKDTMIYLPRPEHAIIKYGDQERHYAVAIPAGEARYVLDRNKGSITLKRGPAIYLPDPRIELIIRRVLDPKTVSLWFPGNREAYDYNRRLAQQNAPQIAAEFAAVTSVPAQATRASAAPKAAPAPGGPAAPPPPPPPSSEFAGDDFTRNQTFTGPRTIVLDTRYDGAVAIDVWTGYAVLVVSKTGERKVVAGPHTHLLEYDETLQVLELSTGTPKTEQNLYKTVYLRVLNNKVSDQVEVETRDLVRVQLQLSYRVNFEGDPNKWFEVENYVKFLTDHLRSLIRAAVKRHGIEQFYADSVAILRDVILGTAGDDGKRPGRRFEENGMRVYDVEVLEVTIGDEAIAELLVQAQHAAVQQTLSLAAEQRRLDMVRQTEAVTQQVAEAKSATLQQAIGLRTREGEQQQRYQLAELAAKLDLHERQQQALQAEQERLGAIHGAELGRRQATATLELSVQQQQLDQRLRELQAEVAAVVEKARAVSPDLIAALQAFGDRALAEKMAESMAPLAILGGESVAEVLGRLLRGSPLARLLPGAANEPDRA
ncbi:SPFH domain-containing protein [Nannocystis punicea]|uniref:SPFH domain-containing protein n=1 Tax=Nannocystis punicea TaxID=2995304 RepID=A0ABY7HGM2_9BACT|nr:SPFH domain-containing protein [Nannocystis poenicansa]WAS98134.1 SPFH domain-containing protein [Nannocystis poenicansa]